MRIQIVTILLLSLPVLMVGQSNDKLEQALGAKKVQELKKSDSEQVAYLAFKANNCYSTQDLSGKKDISDIDDVSTLNALAINKKAVEVNAENFEKETFNPLLYKSTDQTNYYRIGETGVLLKVYGEEQCKALYKK